MAISVEQVSFSYGEHAVLHDVSFSVEPGELLAILGANGVGKSTLFRCMLGLLPHYRGAVTLDGQEMRTLTRRQIARAVAYIPQAASPAFDFTALDVALMGATSHLTGLSSPRSEHVELARRMLAEMGVSHLENRGYSHLSGGERQLVLLARALVQQAKILVMDEPTANLDYGNQQKVMAKVRGLTKQGYTVILSSHDPNQTLQYATRVLTLQKGRVFVDGPPGQVLTGEVLSQLYGVAVERRQLENGMYVCVPGGMLP